MQVIHFVFPKTFRENVNGMLRRLPEPTLAILSGVLMEFLCKRFWEMLGRVIQQLTSCELPHVIQGMLQPLGTELYIEYNRMEMGWHNHLGIDPQAFFLYAEIQAIGDNSTSCLINKYWQPVDDSEGDVIQPHVGNDAIAFHVRIICPCMETFGLQFSKVNPYRVLRKDHCRTARSGTLRDYAVGFHSLLLFRFF